MNKISLLCASLILGVSATSAMDTHPSSPTGKAKRADGLAWRQRANKRDHEMKKRLQEEAARQQQEAENRTKNKQE